LEKVSNQSTPIDTFGNNYQLNDASVINKLLQQSAIELRKTVLDNRRNSLKEKGLTASQFE
jgi:hypothetical protein